MGYTIKIKKKDTGEVVQFRTPHDIRGGTYCIGGTTWAQFSITYNYAKWFYDLWPEPEDKPKKDKTTSFGQMFGGRDGGIRFLYGKPLDFVISELQRGVGTLKGEADENYWAGTEGNARQALFCLQRLCEIAKFECPGAELVLEGD